MPSERGSMKSRRDLIADIEQAIEILCGENGQCLPIEVLDLIGYKVNGEKISLVIDVAERMEYRIEYIAPRWIIFDW